MHDQTDGAAVGRADAPPDAWGPGADGAPGWGGDAPPDAAATGRSWALGAPPQPRTHRWGLPAFLLVEAVFLLVSAVVALPFLPSDGGSGQPRSALETFLLAIVVSTAAAAVVGVLVSRRWTDRWGLPAFLLVESVLVLVSVIVIQPFPVAEAVGGGELRLTVEAFALATVLPTVAAAAVALFVTRWRGNGPRTDLGLVWSWRDAGLGLALGFAGLFLSAIAAVAWVSVVGPDVGSALGDVLAGLRASWPLALGILFAIVIIAPLCEEILYRGLLWGAVEKLGAGPWLAFGITTVVFAVAHFEVLRAPLLLVISIPIGLARLLTGRLIASVVAHAFNNLLPGVVVFLMLIGVELPTPA